MCHESEASRRVASQVNAGRAQKITLPIRASTGQMSFLRWSDVVIKYYSAWSLILKTLVCGASWQRGGGMTQRAPGRTIIPLPGSVARTTLMPPVPRISPLSVPG